MAIELEIKLTLSEQAQSKALDWLSVQSEAACGNRKVLVNRYYDTPDAALNQARAALRVRQFGDRYIQTLKTQGEFVDGAHRRQEWEWSLPGPELDVSLLAETPLNGQLDLQQLALAFETNFTRQVVMLNAADAVIEVAVDSGEIVSGGSVRPLHEVELELKSGQPAALMTWAKALAHEVPVFLNLISKAEQGYYLAGIYQPDELIDTGPIDATRFLRVLSVSWLTEAAFKIPESSLALLQGKAEASGLLDIWREVESEVTASASTRDLMDKVPRLGVLQLALASG